MNLTDGFPHPYTLENANQFIAMATEKNPMIDFQCIEVNGEAAGGIGLSFKTDVYRINAQIGYWLGEEHWNKGIVTEAIRRFTSYTFKTYGHIVRIYAPVFSHNLASMRVLEKAGYRKEAVIRQALVKDQKVEDEHIYSVLRSEYLIN